MTAVPVTGRPVRRRAGFLAPLRLLWLEARRNTMPWLLPLLAALFVFDPYRTMLGYPPIWYVRASVVPNKLLPDFMLFVSGVAAWMASRDARRRTTDLVTTTPRPAWGRRLAPWSATTGWAIMAYLACVAVLYVQIARQVTWGGPPLWPVAVGAVTIAAIAAVAFAAGTFVPGRFTAPVVALATFIVMVEWFKKSVGEARGLVLLSPDWVVPPNDTGVFYHYLPDLAIAQVMFFGGVAVAALGAVGLREVGTGKLARRAALAVTAVGAAAAVGAAGLASTARLEAHGVVIPALHDAASDRPIPYTPVCDSSTVPVCVHPAFRAYLSGVTAALAPVLREVAGLPGAPVRVEQTAIDQVAADGGAAITGSPPIYHLPLGIAPGTFGTSASQFSTQLRAGLVWGFISGPGTSRAGDPAQQAIESALLTAAGVSPRDARTQGTQVPGHRLTGAAAAAAARQQAGISAAAHRFEALSPTARHAWLAAHLPALRAGHLTVKDIP